MFQSPFVPNALQLRLIFSRRRHDFFRAYITYMTLFPSQMCGNSSSAGGARYEEKNRRFPRGSLSFLQTPWIAREIRIRFSRGDPLYRVLPPNLVGHRWGDLEITALKVS